MTRGTRFVITLSASLWCASATKPTVAEPTDAEVRAATFSESTAESEREPPRDDAIRQIARASGGNPAALAHIIQLTSGLDVAAAAEAFDELADAHARAGDLNLASNTRHDLVERFPREPLAAKSILWLVRAYASSEISHAFRKSGAGERSLALQLASTTAREVEDVDPAATLSPEEKNAAAAYGLYLANQAARANPDLNDDASLRFQRSVAARRAGDQKTAHRFLTPLTRADAPEPWAKCARAEAWLEKPTDDQSPKATIVCTVAAAPPHLDGVLDEAMWQGKFAAVLSADPASAKVQSGESHIRFAYDDRFLYVAIRCAKAAGQNYQLDSRPRTHDGDIRDHDRVQLLLDLDRDYATWFELAVDSRGWTLDRCCEDATWNPEWFVAAGEHHEEGAEYWTVEAAIPWSALTEQPPHTGAAWACALERMTPPAGAQVWSGPSKGATGPDDFGLLLFE